MQVEVRTGGICAAGPTVVQAIEPCAQSRVLQILKFTPQPFGCTLHTLLYQAGSVCQPGPIVRQDTVLSGPGTAMCCCFACSDPCGVAVYSDVDIHNQAKLQRNSSPLGGHQHFSSREMVKAEVTALCSAGHSIHADHIPSCMSTLLQAVTCTHMKLLAGCWA